MVTVTVRGNNPNDSSAFSGWQARSPGAGFCLNEGMEKKLDTTIMGFIGTTIRIRSFIPGNQNPKP